MVDWTVVQRSDLSPRKEHQPQPDNSYLLKKKKNFLQAHNLLSLFFTLSASLPFPLGSANRHFCSLSNEKMVLFVTMLPFDAFVNICFFLFQPLKGLFISCHLFNSKHYPCFGFKRMNLTALETYRHCVSFELSKLNPSWGHLSSCSCIYLWSPYSILQWGVESELLALHWIMPNGRLLFKMQQPLTACELYFSRRNH